MYKASLFQKRKSGSRNRPNESKCLAQILPKEIQKMYKLKTGYTANLVFPRIHTLSHLAGENGCNRP